MKNILFILVIIVISSCAAEKQVRNYSQNIALNLEQLENDIAEFSSSRQALAKARMRNILNLRRSTLINDQDRNLQAYLLDALDEQNRVTHYNKIINASELIKENQVTLSKTEAEHKKVIDDIKAELNFQTDRIDDLQKILSQYSSKKKLKQEISFYKDFFKEVREQLKESLEELDPEESGN